MNSRIMNEEYLFYSFRFLLEFEAFYEYLQIHIDVFSHFATSKIIINTIH